ncbi:hypothetical protein HYR99_40235 [Candidatus Poribacteria bacterium]|nr:hypothetical protein [Candidatus Poribacteria bacterium]
MPHLAIANLQSPNQSLQLTAGSAVLLKVLWFAVGFRTKESLSLLSQAQRYYLKENLDETMKTLSEAVALCKQ